MKEAMRRSGMLPPNDNFETPANAVWPLVEFLENMRLFKISRGISEPLTIWEPCCMKDGTSGIATVLRLRSFTVVRTGLECDRRSLDFLLDDPPFAFDIIVTNPPYSQKTEFIRRCFELGKPWAMLMPITALEGIERNKMYRKRWLELLVLDKRIQFQEGKKGCWFNTSWFCYGVLPERLMFAEVEE